MKEAPHHVTGTLKGNNKETPLTAHPSEWQKSPILTTPKADEDVEQQECPFSAAENANQYSHFGRSSGGF